jgi:hypothetical protein
MRIPVSLVLAVVALALAGCGHVRADAGASRPSPAAHTATPFTSMSATSTSATSTSATSTSATSTSAAEPGAAATEADSRFSLVVFDRTTGKAVVNENSSTAYPAESVVKLLIAITALQNGEDEDIVAEMLMTSDDNVANTMWTRYGNVAIIYRAVDQIGLPGVVAPEDSGRWGDTRITADDVVRIYRYLLDRAPKDVSATILKALGSTTRQAADNFYQYYGIVDALDDHDWKVKQGWACCKPARVLHSTGIVGPDDRYIVAALSAHDAATSTWDQVGGELTEAVRRALAGVRQG